MNNSFGLKQHNIPTVMIWLGAMDPVKFASARAEGTTLPGPHTSRFEPQPESVIAMTSVATALLQP